MKGFDPLQMLTTI